MSSIPNRKTKIVCTIGPATDSEEMIGRLITAGMDVARLNFSHGDADSHRRIIRIVRQKSRELGKEIGILQDLCGPKIRLGKLPEEIVLETGQTIIMASGTEMTDRVVPVDYPYLAEDVAAGARILMADGLVEVKVERVVDGQLHCRVIVGGPISSAKGVNLPTSSLRIPSVTDKDKADLQVGLDEKVDFVALSFVRHEDDLQPVIEAMANRKHRPALVAKLEKPEAIERLDQIIHRVDAVMVARGDLGVEMPLEEVPLIQKRIITLARQAGTPVITATQMLRSMVDSPRPTRAEAADVANAVLDGADAVMLSEETAAGSYPIEAVQILDRIARTTEPHVERDKFMRRNTVEDNQAPPTEAAISRAAAWLAEDLGAAAIVASTTSGSTPRNVARFRPSCPVIGLTPNPTTLRQLTLSWGVIPALVENFQSTDQMLTQASAWASARGLAGPGDRLVLTAGVPVGVPGTTNLIKVIELGR